ncbi:hypothetical protein JTB14_016986 [Gonioctena quinquepunctata]|nr:hypothetical protein JTB14_016986 [Gonioctena quinquepunctata]
MFYAIISLPPTNILLLLTIIIIAVVCKEIYHQKKQKIKNIFGDGLLEPPSPIKLPIIGHLHLLSGYEVPYQAFNVLAEKFGNIVNLQLGNIKCVMINGQNNIREALFTKGHHFDSRPNFQRYQQLFAGNKENSLAFCDWSDTQKAKRRILKVHTFPRVFTEKFHTLENLICDANQSLISQIESGSSTDLKQLILLNTANIFFRHFCSRGFNLKDPKFVEVVENFDEVFYEVNQGHAADFLPFLMPLHRKNMQRMNRLTQKIRDFVEDVIIENRFEEFNFQSEPNDYVESLIHYVKSGQSPDLSWDSALFSLEDIIGGHSAVANFLVKLFAFLVKEEEVQKKIQQEIDEVVGRDRLITLDDKNSMPFTQATIYEAVRLIASPIVPRVANQDSSIGGYIIRKGTVLFLNNYNLSMSSELWERPHVFFPQRFIKNGGLSKPEHFLPFGGGRRSCMGNRMVQLISFGILGGLLQHFTIIPLETETYKVPIGSLALKKETFKFRFVRR